MQGGFQGQGFGDRNGDGGMRFLSPIFGLIHLVVLGALLWLGYKLVKKSGWRLARMETSPAPPPSTSETSSMKVEEKKASE